MDFNDRINAVTRTVSGALCRTTTRFIDRESHVVSGKRDCLAAWRGFFASFPDYRNPFTSLSAQGDVVTVIGYSVCSEPALAGPALWTARIWDRQVVTWRIYANTAENRGRLGIADFS
ncbi:hypothetical protein [Streptomyces sp. NBC_00829]|uniref:hypothetical protein n=1 Tax=Streptomyces sp. NBC_00829 TaxID=2903679 RepID=UPI0038634255|nr:hypothetical protein OG293_34150 [Streptomyces sp. NBC_00829]